MNNLVLPEVSEYVAIFRKYLHEGKRIFFTLPFFFSFFITKEWIFFSTDDIGINYGRTRHIVFFVFVFFSYNNIFFYVFALDGNEYLGERKLYRSMKIVVRVAGTMILLEFVEWWTEP